MRAGLFLLFPGKNLAGAFFNLGADRALAVHHLSYPRAIVFADSDSDAELVHAQAPPPPAKTRKRLAKKRL